MKPIFKTIAAAGLSLAAASTASAEGFYIAGMIGISNSDDSANSGSLSSAFTTGEVTGVSPPLDFPAGTPLSWNTDLSNGNLYGGAFGYDYGNVRVELELSRNDADVEKHSGLQLDGIALGAIDAGVLISGTTQDLNVTTQSLLLNAIGEVTTTSVMLNGYYDFDFGGAITPYVGAGIGNAQVDVVFAPSGTAVADTDDDGFAWQLIVGAEYAATDAVSFYGNYRYFQSDDATIDLSLLPASLDIENSYSVIEIGMRFSF